MPSQPLPVAEIESLLRHAQENVFQSASTSHDELLGPGDVQYLRGESSRKTAEKPPTLWPEPTHNPDHFLQQVEQHLSDAIVSSQQSPSSSTVAMSRIAGNSKESQLPISSDQGVTLDDLRDVEIDISIELGRAEVLIEDVLKLREGSVVSLDKLAGDPVDIVANGKLVARGELLVIDGKFGVRLCEVL